MPGENHAAGLEVSFPPRRSTPSYFHLLWDHELPALRYIFETIGRHREEVLQHWHQLYLLHFGDSRSLPDRTFFEIFGAELDAITDAIISQDLERFAAEVRKSSERMRENHVPFSDSRCRCICSRRAS